MTINPKRVIDAIAVLAIPTILVTGLATWAYHPIRVWLANGEWCAQFNPDGTPDSILYGTDCRNIDTTSKN